ncbi:MAG: hypothetical protein ACYCSO_06940 [Cuniculiplasma sp.]
MGITVIPKERDQTTDLTKLEIKFKGGDVESPSRFITKVDLNSKDRIGADVPLSRTRRLFLYEEWINPNKISRILCENGYLATFLTNFRNFLQRVEKGNPLKLIYPKFTADGLKDLKNMGEVKKTKVWEFIFQAISELSIDKNTIDGFCIQYDYLTDAAKKYVMKQSLSFIPTMDIHGPIKNVEKQLDTYSSMPSSIVPFIGLSYSSFTRSNLGYQHAISILDGLHENGKGFITLDSPRISGRYSSDPDISALHYSNFIVADLVAERVYNGGSPNTQRSVRLFDRSELAVDPIQSGSNVKKHEGECEFLQMDLKLNALLNKMFEGNINDSDITRATDLSRVHENIITEKEYGNMRKSIANSELINYRKEKHRIDLLLSKEGR